MRAARRPARRAHTRPAPNERLRDEKRPPREAGSGFRLGDTNNERTFYRVKGDPGDIRRPWWGSPDSGRAGRWIRRDRMPDLDHARRFYVDAEFDKRDDDDPTCTIKWKKGLP